MKNKNMKGFTLIELLIVISILAILMAGAYLALNPKEKQDKARAARVLNDIKQIEKAFKLSAIDLNRDTYPLESEFGGEKTIKYLVENNLLKYFSLKGSTLNGKDIIYDNDGDKYQYLNNCPGDTSNNHQGVDLYFLNTDEAVWLALDELVDKGNGLGCGKVIKSVFGSNIYYKYILDDNK